MWWTSVLKMVILCSQEKPLNVEASRPYRKPTQVGRERILRRLSEMRLRNSANYHRKFAIRWASNVKFFANGA